MAETERLNVLKVQLQALNAVRRPGCARAAACSLAAWPLTCHHRQANDLLADLPAFVSYHCRGLTARLAFYRSADLPPLLLDWALALTERHMRPMYEAAPGWGWSIAKKHAELAHEDARFVVVTAAEAAEQLLPSVAAAGAAEEAVAAVATLAAEQQQLQHIASGQPLAFMHFRFEEEEGDAVAYLYEIQVGREWCTHMGACTAMQGQHHNLRTVSTTISACFRYRISSDCF